MPYTMKDFRRDYVREHLHELPVEERLADLEPEERLAGLSKKQIEAYLKQIEKDRAEGRKQPPKKKR